MRFVFIGKSHDFSFKPLEALLTRHRVAGIVESAPRVPKATKSSSSRVRRLLAGLRPSRPERASLRSLADSLRVPYMELRRNNHADLVGFLRRAEAEIICVASLSQLIKREVLQVPPHGAINLHPSLLPKYPGPFPWFWQYYNFEKELGVTVHAIDEGEDTGPLLKQTAVPLPTGTDIAEAIRMVTPIGARLMLEAVDAIEVGRSAPIPQSFADHPRARVVRRDEKLIDWKGWGLERVWHVMRGTYPWLDAVEPPQGRLAGGRWRIGRMERGSEAGRPGTVGRDERGHYVCHPEGKIRLHLEISWSRRLRNFARRS